MNICGRDARKSCAKIGASAGLALLASGGAAQAKVAIQGNVAWWNPETNQYQPLKRARVRMVLAEDYDYDTGDVETTTGDDGTYRITKGNPWWRQSYKAHAIVFAEVPDKVEIQSHYLQVDGYQAATGNIKAKQNKTSVINVRIGGPEANVNYHVGGIAALDNADATDATHGWRAFVLCDNMTDHRLRLMGRGIGNDNFEEKEMTFPYNDNAVAAYQNVWDYIRFPDSYFDIGLDKVSKGVRHEMSHGIMADMYAIWPGTFHGSAGSHSLGKVAERREFAWSEAWAEFMGQVTQQDAQGKTYGDFETQASTLPGSAPWRKEIPPNADRSYVEGEIVSALWDIYDGQGMETRMDQVAEIPGEEQFYDGISDQDLSKIWGIFSDKHPHSFTHESFAGSSDSFVWYWVHKTNYGQHHELKSILFNRGIRVNELAQHAPTMKLGAISWSGFSLKVPVTVNESDAEDRPAVRVQLFSNGQLVTTRTLANGWNGGTNTLTLEQNFGWKKGAAPPNFVVAVSDDMQSDWKQQTVTPPASAIIGNLAIELQSVRSPGGMKIPLTGKSITIPNLNVSLLSGSGTESNRVDLPSMQLNANQPLSYDTAQEIFRTTNLADELHLAIKVEGIGKFGDQNVPVSEWAFTSVSANEGYGVGEHTVVIPLKLKLATSPFSSVTTKIPLSVNYRIVPVAEKTAPFFMVLAPQTVPIFFPIITPAEDAPGTTKPLPKTPGAMMARSQSLLRQVARMQASVVEITNELEWKASKQGLAQKGRIDDDNATSPVIVPPIIGRKPPIIQLPNRRAPSIKTPDETVNHIMMIAPADAPIARLLNPELVQPSGLLKLPVMPFLNQALNAEALNPTLDTAARAGLDELTQNITDLQTRLQSASADATILKTRLDAFALQAANAPVVPGALKVNTKIISETTQRLAQVPAAVQAATPILAQQRQVIMLALQRVQPGGVPLRLPEVPLRGIEDKPRFKLDVPDDDSILVDGVRMIPVVPDAIKRQLQIPRLPITIRRLPQR